jgi:hypothetical protein
MYACKASLQRAHSQACHVGSIRSAGYRSRRQKVSMAFMWPYLPVNALQYAGQCSTLAPLQLIQHSWHALQTRSIQCRNAPISKSPEVTAGALSHGHAVLVSSIHRRTTVDEIHKLLLDVGELAVTIFQQIVDHCCPERPRSGCRCIACCEGGL